jgi:GrpB-like predicted nucleotidyltransferase (UPF0157 family)
VKTPALLGALQNARVRPKATELRKKISQMMPLVPSAKTALESNFHRESPSFMDRDQDPVHIRDYDAIWPSQFGGLAARIVGSLGRIVTRVEHVGSTAVPGLIAKPIIDLDAVLASPADLPEAIRTLRGLGYVHEGDLGIKGREAFIWPPGEVRHHLYVLVEGAIELRRHIEFRDALRGNSALREGYAHLKRALAAQFPCDRKSYTEGKSAFIAAALAEYQRAT